MSKTPEKTFLETLQSMLPEMKEVSKEARKNGHDKLADALQDLEYEIVKFQLLAQKEKK